MSGSRASVVACWAYRDEAVNTLFELGSKDTDLRGEVLRRKARRTARRTLVVSEHPVQAPAENTDDNDAALETIAADPTNSRMMNARMEQQT